MQNLGDTDLILRVKDGNQQAFSELMNRYMPMIYSLNLRMLRTPQDAEDATQDVFFHAYQRIGQFKGDSKFSTWLYRIAVNMNLRTLHKKRWQSQEVSSDFAIEKSDPANNPMQALIEKDEHDNLRQLITTLPPKQKLVLMLRAIKQLPFAEIATITRRSLGSVKANYFLAVQHLTHAIQKEGK